MKFFFSLFFCFFFLFFRCFFRARVSAGGRGGREMALFPVFRDLWHFACVFLGFFGCFFVVFLFFSCFFVVFFRARVSAGGEGGGKMAFFPVFPGLWHFACVFLGFFGCFFGCFLFSPCFFVLLVRSPRGPQGIQRKSFTPPPQSFTPLHKRS